MARRQRRKKLPEGTFPATIESLSHEGRGVAHLEGKTLFIDNALPEEQVEFRYVFSRKQFDEGVAETIANDSADRVEPPCQHADICGGCSLQHMATTAQIAFKQDVLKQQLQHFAAVEPDEWLAPILSEDKGYRTKARLGVKYVPKKGGTLVGFREKRSSFIADIQDCHILHDRVSCLMLPLRELVAQLSIRDRVPQFEVAVGGDELVIIIRHLLPFSAEDLERWKAFAEQYDVKLLLQPKGPDSIHVLYPEGAEPWLYYSLPEFNLKYQFHPTDFTQVNVAVNEKMVSQAVELLDLQPTDRVLDLFCGLGNFTLPIAKNCQQVIGVEGSEAMVVRGKDNASQNGINNASFYCADLSKNCDAEPWAEAGFDKILVDPPRSGALEVLPQLAKLGAKRIVYVSCNPATLARDAGELQKLGYHLLKAGVMDMFPHTSHVESMVVFDKV